MILQFILASFIAYISFSLFWLISLLMLAIVIKDESKKFSYFWVAIFPIMLPLMIVGGIFQKFGSFT